MNTKNLFLFLALAAILVTVPMALDTVAFADDDDDKDEKHKDKKDKEKDDDDDHDDVDFLEMLGLVWAAIFDLQDQIDAIDTTGIDNDIYQVTGSATCNNIQNDTISNNCHVLLECQTGDTSFNVGYKLTKLSGGDITDLHPFSITKNFIDGEIGHIHGLIAPEAVNGTAFQLNVINSCITG